MTQQNPDRSNQADPRNAALMELSDWDPAWGPRPASRSPQGPGAVFCPVKLSSWSEWR